MTADFRSAPARDVPFGCWVCALPVRWLGDVSTDARGLSSGSPGWIHGSSADLDHPAVVFPPLLEGVA